MMEGCKDRAQAHGVMSEEQQGAAMTGAAMIACSKMQQVLGAATLWGPLVAVCGAALSR
jgi:hypothetical protein